MAYLQCQIVKSAHNLGGVVPKHGDRLDDVLRGIDVDGEGAGGGTWCGALGRVEIVSRVFLPKQTR